MNVWVNAIANQVEESEEDKRNILLDPRLAYGSRVYLQVLPLQPWNILWLVRWSVGGFDVDFLVEVVPSTLTS